VVILWLRKTFDALWGLLMRHLVSAYALGLAIILPCIPAMASAKSYGEMWESAARVLRRDSASCRTGFPEARRLIELGKQTNQFEGDVAGMAALATICASRNRDSEAILEFGPVAEGVAKSGDPKLIELSRSLVVEQLYSAMNLEKAELALGAFHRMIPGQDDENYAGLDPQVWWTLKGYADRSPNPREEVAYVNAQLERMNYRGLTTIDAAMLKQNTIKDGLLYATDGTQLSVLLPQVEHTDTALEVLFDKRFAAAAARPEAARLRDLTAIGNAAIAADTKRASDNPNVLQGSIFLSQSLRRMNRAADALPILLAAEVKAGKSRTAFTDQAEQLSWLFNEKAYVLRDLGRLDEAFAAMTQGSRVDEGRRGNVSQTINLAIMQMTAGRFSLVGGTLRQVGSGGTEYATSLMDGLSYCAAVQSGTNPANGDQVINGLKSLGENGRTSLFSTALCANKLDLAAEAFLALLEDPASRGRALIAGQAYRQESTTRSPFQVLIRERALLILARPDVKAKLDLYGNSVTIPYRIEEYEY
jgi:hypothetical protein